MSLTVMENSPTSTLPTLANSQQLLTKYQTIRAQSLAICAPLQAEDYVVQPTEDVSPPKWHLGHVTWFFENFILVPQLTDYQPFDLRLNWFFNSYYESQGERILRSNRGNMTRPSLQIVLDYRAYVDRHIAKCLAAYEQKALPKELVDLVEIGLQHEQQHQELLVMDIKYILGTNPFRPTYFAEEVAPLVQTNKYTPQKLNFLKLKEGIYEIGYKDEGFCWDNEQSAHKVYLHDFEISDRLITNGEYLEFMEAGGYENHAHWLSEGWAWAKNLEEKAPLYWYKKEGEWWHYTLRGLERIDLDLPVVHVSYFEADAFANWKGMRLPTEFEWEAAAREFAPSDVSLNFANLLETNALHPKPQTNETHYQFLGDVWEWTGSSYLPYPNYPRFKGALGEYNGKFMINQMVLRGGCCATPKSHIRLTYRNFFPTKSRWLFSGFRLAK